MLARLEGNADEAGRWLIRSIGAFVETNDEHSVAINVNNLRIVHGEASPEEKAKIEAMWREAGFGEWPFPRG